MRRLWRWLGLLGALWLGLAPAAHAIPTWHFRLPPGPPPVTLSTGVLSAEERTFLASLPEIRVALQRVGAPPFERVGPDGEISGLQPEMLATLARTLGLRLKPQVYEDFPSVLKAVQEGRADMVLTLAASPARRLYLDFTLGTVNVPAAVFARAGQPTLDLEHARFANERGYSSGDYIARRFPAAQVLPVDTTMQALRLVAEGRADAYVGSLLEALDMLSRDPVPGIEVRQILADRQGYYSFGIRKDWPQLVAILNRGIANWRAGPEAAGAAASAMAASAVPQGLTLPSAMPLSSPEAAALAQHPVWRVGAVRGLTLLNDFSVSAGHTGIASDYLEQVRNRLGMTVELVPYDSVEAMLDGLRKGEIDVTPYLTRTPDREREFVFSRPYMTLPYFLVARTDAPMYWDLASLRGKRLALGRDHPLRPLVEQRFPDIAIVAPPPGALAMDLVSAGDADAAVDVKLFANLRINRDGSGLRVLGAVEDLPGHFAFATAPRAAALVPLIDRALGDIPPSENDRLLRRWVAVDLQPEFPWRRWMPTIAVAGGALLLLALATAWWMQRLRAEVRRRRRADEQMDDIGRTMPGVAFRYLLGADQRLLRTFYTSGAERFFGFAPPPMQTVVGFIGPYLGEADRAAAEAAQRHALSSGETFRHSLVYRHPDGRERWLQAEAVRSVTREGLTAWTGYVIDATAERALNQQLAQEARQRHLMLASASHELRAPAHQLILALQDASLNALTLAAQRAVGIARDAARTIAQLLDDVLDAARLDAGRLQLHEQEFDLHALLAQLADMNRPVMEAKGLVLLLQLAPDVPRTVHADPLRLKQVLMNLLSNAAKYTASGRVLLQADIARDEAAPQLRLQVRDTGVGIAPEMQQRLFEPFVTLHGAGDAPAMGSSGLGLSICRRLVELMGGRITLASERGVGTDVGVRLPLERLAPGAGARAPVRRDGLLLLCDDDEVSRMLMAAALGRLGHRVVEAARGDDALLRWQQGDVRIVITDLSMPGLHGADLAGAIRRAEAADPQAAARGRTGIVFCSGSAPAELGSPLSADAYLSKPVDMAVLADTLAALGAAAR